MNDADWIDYTGFLSTGHCPNFAFGTIETYFGGSIQEIILLQSIYVLTMLEVVEEIPSSWVPEGKLIWVEFIGVN